MKRQLDWVFDPLPASGRREGGTAASYVFQPTLDVFIREVLQNAHDQRVGADPIRVSFSFISLTGSHKERFLERIAWESLLSHLRGTSVGSTRLAPMIREALDKITSEPLRLLTISDYGGRGLTGGEQGDGNFNALCRDTLMTTEDRASRGGSHGLGKAVLWRFSQFSTVLFSSVLKKDDNPYRLFGRTELPYHEAEGEPWSGPGWWGERKSTGRGDRAESVWGGDAIAAATGTPLDRSPDDGTGTTIVVVGFHEPAEEDSRSLQSVAKDVLDSAVRWFWPSLARDPQTLQVVASVHENQEQVFHDQARITSEVFPFRHAVVEQHSSRRALEPLQVAERQIEIGVPALKEPGHDDLGGPVKGRALLRLVRVGDDSNGAEYRNRIALVRGAGMVVEYWRPARIPLEGGGFHAVLLAGEAHGDSKEDSSVERFLRAAEPPAHDRWVHHTDQVRNKYRQGAKARLDELWATLNTAVVEMTQSEPPSDAEGPRMLAKLFPIGDVAASVSQPKKFDVEFTHQSFIDGSWTIGGRLERRPTEADAWQVTVAIWMDGDSSTRSEDDLLPIASLSIGDGEGDARAWVSDAGTGVIEVPEDVSTVSYSLKTESGDPHVLRRTRVRAEVRPKLRKVTS